MQLIKLSKNTYYIENNTNIGIYKLNDRDIILIDSGIDESVGKKILKITEENNFNIVAIINTHSHADHIGGNKIIQNKTNCKIYSNNIETNIINNPLLEPSYIYGAYPFKQLRNKFLEAKSSSCEQLVDIEGLEYFTLKGHSFDMVCIKTVDNVYFIGDALFNELTLNKYSISYLYNVSDFLNSLDILSNLKGTFVLSHGQVCDDITSLINLNKNKVYEIIDKIIELCKEEISFEELLKNIFDIYNLEMNLTQRYLIGSTIKSYLSYLIDNNKIIYCFNNNIMYFKSIN